MLFSIGVHGTLTRGRRTDDHQSSQKIFYQHQINNEGGEISVPVPWCFFEVPGYEPIKSTEPRPKAPRSVS